MNVMHVDAGGASDGQTLSTAGSDSSMMGMMGATSSGLVDVYVIRNGGNVTRDDPVLRLRLPRGDGPHCWQPLHALGVVQLLNLTMGLEHLWADSSPGHVPLRLWTEQGLPLSDSWALKQNQVIYVAAWTR